MKICIKIAFAILIVFIRLKDIKSSEIGHVIPDSIKFMRTSNHLDSIKETPNMYLYLSTGLLINSTTGCHPIINMLLGFKKSKNRFNLTYEYRFGNSDKYYKILDNDTLKSINAYKANYIGFEYQRLIFKNVSHELYTNTGIGIDWIFISESETIKNNKIIGGLALNIGIGYAFYIKKKHGPNIELLYHFTNFSDIKGTKIDNNSILIRLSYNFMNDYKQK